MRKLGFGTLRTSRSARLKWLDYHNLLGIVALAWMTVVGITGVINTLEDPINKLWRSRELAAMTREYAGRGALPPEHCGSLDKAMAEARKALPGVVDLAGRVGRDYTTASHQIARLEELGLVTRRPSAADKRDREAVITPVGKQATDALDAAREELALAMFKDWTRKDFDDLARLMRRLAEAMSG